VSGLSGSGLVLQNNGGDDLAINANGSFTFATALPDLSAYAVTIRTQPVGQTCELAAASGTLAGAPVTDIEVLCRNVGIGVDVSDIDFGMVILGGVTTRSVRITNTGEAALNLTGLIGPAAPFMLNGGSCTPPVSLATGASCELELSIEAAALGEFSDELQIISSAADSPLIVRLSARVIPEPLPVFMIGLPGLLMLLMLMLIAAARRLRSGRPEAV